MKRDVKAVKKKEKDQKQTGLENEYKKFFGGFPQTPIPDSESLAQPPFYHYVPTETTASPYQGMV
jgi:hypothetical protein